MESSRERPDPLGESPFGCSEVASVFGGQDYACHRILVRDRGTHRGDIGLVSGSVEGRTIARSVRPLVVEGGYGRREPLPVRAHWPLPPPALPTRKDPCGLRPRPVGEPVVVVPNDRELGGRCGPPRPLSVLDLRLLDRRPAPLFGCAAAARPG